MRINKDEKGIVSIVVTVIVLLVITITSLGFSRLAQREQRQALDRQLSTQAYYAAEAGINDAKKIIGDTTSAYYAGNKISCRDAGTNQDPEVFSGVMSKIDLSTTFAPSSLGNITGAAEYSCVLIRHDPEELIFDVGQDNGAKYADMTAVDNSGSPKDVNYFKITWTTKDATTGRSTGGLVPYGNWVNAEIGMLRIDLTHLNLGFDRNSLQDNTMTAFLYPRSNSGSSPQTLNFGNFVGTNRGEVQDVNCSSGSCEARINVSGLTNPQNHFYLRLRAIYKDLRVVVEAYDNSGGKLRIKGAQTVIDSTGKASDVLRRIQVRVSRNVSAPEYAIESVDAICKRLETRPGTTTANTSGISPPDDAACQP